MKRLTKTQLAEKQQHMTEIDVKLSDLNSAIEAASVWMSEIHDQMQEYYDDRSERWQEGEAGQSYADWMASWDSELDTVECEAYDTLNDLTEERNQ